jgi:large subunit ribosomal protein L9
MKVLLRSDVDGVGRRGDIVEVAGGFARNYLLPEGRAMVATEGVQAQAEAMRKSRDLREAKDKATAGAQAALLTGAVLRLEVRAGKAGRLFGSVSAADVAEAVKAQKGVEVNRHHVGLAEPIKVVGTYEVPVELFGDVSAVITVEVVAAGGE